MKTVIIGSGNVAYHMTKAFLASGVSVVQIFGRNQQALSEISQETGVPYSTNQLEDADFYLIAVSDSSIVDVSIEIQNKDCLVAHTSGSMPLSSLQGNYRKAVLYPLQTFSKSKSINYSEIPFFIDAENKDDLLIIENLVKQISNKVSIADDDKRKYIHLTAVMACNFVNHLYTKAKEISDSQGIPFSYFLPLIKETAEKIESLDPKLAQTGPAVRGDERVLKLHEEIITDPQLLEIYKIMNRSIKITKEIK